MKVVGDRGFVRLFVRRLILSSNPTFLNLLQRQRRRSGAELVSRDVCVCMCKLYNPETHITRATTVLVKQGDISSNACSLYIKNNNTIKK